MPGPPYPCTYACNTAFSAVRAWLRCFGVRFRVVPRHGQRSRLRMGQASYVTASDGHTARVAPLWTEEKLAILRCYLQGFAKACQSHPSGWHALDVFAGGGLNVSELTQAEIPSSALIALEAGPPPARRVVLCERDARALAALTARVGPFGNRVA